MKKSHNLLILGLFAAVLQAQTYCPPRPRGFTDLAERATAGDQSWGYNDNWLIDVWGDNPGSTVYAWGGDPYCPWYDVQEGSGQYWFEYNTDFQVPVPSTDFGRVMWSVDVTITPDLTMWNDCSPCNPTNYDLYRLTADEDVEFWFRNLTTGASHVVTVGATKYPGSHNPIVHYARQDETCEWYVDNNGYSGNIHLQATAQSPPQPAAGCYVLEGVMVYLEQILYSTLPTGGISGDVWLEARGAATDVFVWWYK